MRAPFIWTLILSITVLPGVSAEAAGQSKAVKVQNVELNESGVVRGQLTDPAGKPIAGKTIEIRTKSGTSKDQTDAKGQFTVASETSGNCAILVDGNAYACRLWTHKTAPPKSLTSFTIVPQNGPVVRGQGYDDCAEGCSDGCGGGRLGSVSKGQLLGLGLLAGAVVAIVIAANNDDDDASN